MNTQLAKLKRIAIFLAGISTASIPAMVHADWSIKGLGTLGGDLSSASAINDSGQVVGLSFNASNSKHAFITGPNGIGMTDLGTLLGGNESAASGINDSGQVVGYSDTSSSRHAFITGFNGKGMTDLGTLSGKSSIALGINNSGQVVGEFSNGYLGYGNIFFTGPNGVGMTDLGIYSDALFAGINDSGQIAGTSYPRTGFITGPNGIGRTDLEASKPNGINDYGQVVGTGVGRNERAFVTGPDGIGMTDLGTFGGLVSSANGINNSGEVVGWAATASGEGHPFGEAHPFIFSHGGITDLLLLAPVIAAGWTYLIPNDINNNGQIVGYGSHNGNYEAFLLSYTSDTIFDPKPIYIPHVPEPETYLMLLAGLGLLGFMARRRKESAV